MDPAKILIVDDERTICEGCKLALADEHYSVDFCFSGKEGLKYIEERGRYDLILLDMKLPDMDGMNILEIVHRETPDIYVIVMTGYSTVRNAVEAMKLGAVDYLSKPFTDDELTISVSRAIEKKRLVEENVQLKKELVDRFGFSNVIGEDQKILTVFEQVKKVAPTDSTVLIYGESGTGKELFARAIQANSLRSGKKFIAVDCSTLSPSLLESELFGHVKGAFTGATHDKAGIFEVANHGTLFLDDIANLSLEIQGKLLRVLEVYEYKPVGSSEFKKTNMRIIAATNKDLKAMVDQGDFREDLYYRLNVFPIYLPPLRERKDDIPKLSYHFLRLFCRKTGKRIEGFSDDALEILILHSWPGNVRQLKNVIERLVIMADREIVGSLDIIESRQMKSSMMGERIPETLAELKTVKKQITKEYVGQLEKAFLIQALKASKGNITQAAERVGMQRSNFSSLMKKHYLSSKETLFQLEDH
ncbi:sigma-54-dependent transcriptional regulator [Thermodesulfobacteriota bacterium]